MQNLDITLSRTTSRDDVGEAQAQTLAGVLASLENPVRVDTEHGTVKVWDGDGWIRTYSVRYGNQALVMGPVQRVRHCRIGSSGNA